MSKFKLTSPGATVGRAAVHIEPMAVELRLAELHPDLSSLVFRDAVIGGLSERNAVTRASAPTAAGLNQWLKTVEDLRTILARLQWKIHEHKNCPFISSPDRSVSIVVMTGNSETGNVEGEDPANQAEKGAVVENYVENNVRQLELFSRAALSLVKSNKKETQVWVLLYYYDKALKQIRFELSLPTGFSKRKITAWDERLVFPAVSNDPSTFAIRKEEPIAPVVFDVVPKKGAI